MKTSKILKRISSIALLFVMVFGLFSTLGDKITVNAATDKVKMYLYDPYFTKYGHTQGDVYIQINDNASNKAAYVHYQTDMLEWEDEQATYVTTLSDGSQIWKATIITSTLEYAIKYVGDGQTYWDNNNGNNYSSANKLGTAPIKVDRLQNSDYSNFRIQTTLKNLAYAKVVKVRYTEDNWATYTDASLSYESSNASQGTEVWSSVLSLDSSKKDSFQYCVYYQVNGQTYWANNFGSNYDINYIYHQ